MDQTLPSTTVTQVDLLLQLLEKPYLFYTSPKMSYIPNYTASNQPPPQPPTTYTTTTAPQQQNVTQLKRKMTLDLSNAKRPRVFSVNTPGVIADVLSSPDVQMLKIPTPDLDRLIMSTTNPNVLQTPTSVFFPKNVTEEQELYAKGFEQALAKMHDQDSVQSSNQDSNASSGYQDGGRGGFVDFSNVVVKEEPQTVPDSFSDDEDDDSSLSDGSSSVGSKNYGHGPINMKDQEKIKLERKRQRNRLAASKCRRKKLERIAKLEGKVKQLKNENDELGSVLVKLRESVQLLKTQVYDHIQAGCPIVLNGANNSFS